jgi:hypothetical protein
MLDLHEPLEAVLGAANTRPQTHQEITRVASSAARMELGVAAASRWAEVEERVVHAAATPDAALPGEAQDLLRQAFTLLMRQAVLATAADDYRDLAEAALDFQAPLMDYAPAPQAVEAQCAALRRALRDTLERDQSEVLDTVVRPVCRHLAAAAHLAAARPAMIAAVQKLPEVASAPALLPLLDEVLLAALAGLLPGGAGLSLRAMGEPWNRIERHRFAPAAVRNAFASMTEAMHRVAPCRPLLEYQRHLECLALFCVAAAEAVERRDRIVAAVTSALADAHPERMGEGSPLRKSVSEEAWTFVKGALFSLLPGGDGVLYDFLYRFDEQLARERRGAAFAGDFAAALREACHAEIHSTAADRIDRTLADVGRFLVLSAEVADHLPAMADKACEELTSRFRDEFDRFPRQVASFKWDWEVLFWTVRFGLLPGQQTRAARMFDASGYVLACSRFFSRPELVTASYDVLEQHVRASFSPAGQGIFLAAWKRFRAHQEQCLSLAGRLDRITSAVIQEVRRRSGESFARVANAEMLLQRDLEAMLFTAIACGLHGGEECMLEGMRDFRESLRRARLSRDMVHLAFSLLAKEVEAALPGAEGGALAATLRRASDCVRALADIGIVQDEIVAQAVEEIRATETGMSPEQAEAHVREDMALLLEFAALQLVPGGGRECARRLGLFADAIAESPIPPESVRTAVAATFRAARRVLPKETLASLADPMVRMERAIASVLPLAGSEQSLLDAATAAARIAPAAAGTSLPAVRLAAARVLRRAALAALPASAPVLAEALAEAAAASRAAGLSAQAVGDLWGTLRRDALALLDKAEQPAVEPLLARAHEALVLAAEAHREEARLLDAAAGSLPPVEGVPAQVAKARVRRVLRSALVLGRNAAFGPPEGPAADAGAAVRLHSEALSGGMRAAISKGADSLRRGVSDLSPRAASATMASFLAPMFPANA